MSLLINSEVLTLMWFLFAVLTALAWGTADLFYKKGSNPDDKYSHLKIVIMVGIVMGIHATFYMLTNNLTLDFSEVISYLPVSALYIISMTIGYVGLRYIALSIASPIQNSSGVVTSILLFIIFSYSLSFLQVFGIAIISIGVILLAVLERKYEILEIQKTEKIDAKFKYGFLAIFFPILYAIFDGAGTFVDAIYLDELELISEDMALLAYEYTFLAVAVVTFIFLKIKKVPMNPFKEYTRASAAIFETAGQFFYVFAMASNAIISAPIIACYSIFSVLLSRIFLKERLTKLQYAIVLLVMIGIALLGIADEM